VAACRDIGYVLDKLEWMRAEGIWPNGLRYLWTDAFGVVLLVSLHAALKDPQYLEQARTLVADVDRVDSLHSYFDGYRSGDEYDREAITHVMACSSHLPGYLLRGYA
jgi:hypothetical protein